jgi:hypothetical protein
MPKPVTFFSEGVKLAPKPPDTGILVPVVGDVDDEARSAGADVGVRRLDAAAPSIVFQQPVQDRCVGRVETAFEPLQPVALLNDLADVPVRLRRFRPGEFWQWRDFLRRPHTGPTAEEQCVVASLSYHIGIRGTTYVQGAFEKTRSFGYNIITLRELFARGFAEVLAELRERVKGHPVYLCFDMDVFDPSCAPGVATPSWGGLSAREGIEFLRGLVGLDVIAVDVNTVSPPHDVQNMTAFLAAQVIYESLVSLCQKPS